MFSFLFFFYPGCVSSRSTGLVACRNLTALPCLWHCTCSRVACLRIIFISSSACFTFMFSAVVVAETSCTWHSSCPLAACVLTGHKCYKLPLQLYNVNFDGVQNSTKLPSQTLQRAFPRGCLNDRTVVPRSPGTKWCLSTNPRSALEPLGLCRRV